MDGDQTVVFIGITGSAGLLETLGEARAAESVARLSQWLAEICHVHGGRVVQNRAGRMLVAFAGPTDAVHTLLRIQRHHQKRILTWPIKRRLRLKVGVARGEIREQAGMALGPAVVLATRLGDHANADQIWADEAVVEPLTALPGLLLRKLDMSKARDALDLGTPWLIDGSEEAVSAQPATTVTGEDAGGEIELRWQGVRACFRPRDMPIRVGRHSEVEFVVSDPRVSRLHARIDYRDGRFVLSDASSFGTWVRFGDNATDQPLQRGECVLTGACQIALGAPADSGVPTVALRVL
jgi:adenylate cyclase